MVSMYSVNCMMCGRSSGQLRSGVFQRANGAPPMATIDGRTRCGFCTGNLYLEPDDSIVATLRVDQAAFRQRRLAS